MNENSLDADVRQQTFKCFEGETITKVDATCINVVKFYMESGNVLEINADDLHYGIPVLSAETARFNKT